jgi:hypothetical protein
MSHNLVQLPMKLCIRAEGDNWNAYIESTDTTNPGFVYIGSIAKTFIENNEQRKKAFINLMKEAMSDLVEDITGYKTLITKIGSSEYEKIK